jgi:hypothetical protein
MKHEIAKMEIIIGKIEHNAPSCDHYPVPVKNGDMLIVFVDAAHNPLILGPASKMDY